MAVKIRLRRMGQKKAPFYRIVVADSRSPRDGKMCIRDRFYDAFFECICNRSDYIWSDF